MTAKQASAFVQMNSGMHAKLIESNVDLIAARERMLETVGSVCNNEVLQERMVNEIVMCFEQEDFKVGKMRDNAENTMTAAKIAEAGVTMGAKGLASAGVTGATQAAVE